MSSSMSSLIPIESGVASCLYFCVFTISSVWLCSTILYISQLPSGIKVRAVAFLTTNLRYGVFIPKVVPKLIR